MSVYIFWLILSVVQWKQGSGMGFQADLLRVLSLDCCSKSKQTPSCAGSLMRTPSSKVTPVCLLCVVLLTRTHGSPSSSTRNTNSLLLGLSALDGQIQEDRAFWLWCLRCLEDHLLQDVPETWMTFLSTHCFPLYFSECLSMSEVETEGISGPLWCVRCWFLWRQCLSLKRMFIESLRWQLQFWDWHMVFWKWWPLHSVSHPHPFPVRLWVGRVPLNCRFWSQIFFFPAKPVDETH